MFSQKLILCLQTIKPTPRADLSMERFDLSKILRCIDKHIQFVHCQLYMNFEIHFMQTLTSHSDHR